MSKNYKQGASVPLWISQNFLTSGKVIRQAISVTGLCKDDAVIEIGPGKGHITKELAKNCKSVTAIELDGRLYAKLKETLCGFSNVRLYHQDFLRWNLPAKGVYRVFANIPFSITSKIITRLTTCPNPPADAWLVLEKGAAKRFMGVPKETERSLCLKPFFDISVVYHFRKEDFHPMPGVDTVLTRISLKKSPDIPKALRKQYELFVKARNDARSANMLYVQWLCLFRRWAGLPPSC